MPKHPEITIKLIGTDGNAFAVMGEVLKALREADVPDAERLLFSREASQGDYDNMLKVCGLWVSLI